MQPTRAWAGCRGQALGGLTWPGARQVGERERELKCVYDEVSMISYQDRNTIIQNETLTLETKEKFIS